MNEVLEPDLIILNEGLFPKGPEANIVLDDNYLMCYTSDGKRSFDIDKIKEIVGTYNNVVLNEMDYSDIDPSKAYGYSLIYGLQDDLKKNDLIFPLEVDVFFHEKDKENINDLLNIIDIASTVEYIRLFSPCIELLPRKRRKFVFKWGDGEFYKDWHLNHFLGCGDDISDSVFTKFNIQCFHTELYRKGKWFDARMSQLPRHGRIREELYSIKNYYEVYKRFPKDLHLERINIQEIDIDLPTAIRKIYNEDRLQ
jgi:hypothetical protein